MLEALVVAFILSLFEFDLMFIECVNELFGLSITSATYYVLFALVGLIKYGL